MYNSEQMRDEFTDDVKRNAAARVAYQCSNPSCRTPTCGPQLDPAKALNVGVAAHISAASPGGPRYNPSLTAAERIDPNNAIWLCQNCAKLVDNDVGCYSETLLKKWKRDAENIALLRIGKTVTGLLPSEHQWAPEELDILLGAAERGEIVLLEADQVGKWVRVGSRDFLDQTDPAFAANYLDALESLCSRKLVRHDDGILFVLTSTGFKVARALRESASIEYDKLDR